ncbi:O-fucosyltransferase family protein [Actinidia rufa]|uniref:O-fucosyltransferase family protein n=1 Tax=Actinidia rufa TaxID=165716 RepID=A0A7J0EG99_9ERIC|nr:O-fucosyltransferase family protein [Actinidia rufa]
MLHMDDHTFVLYATPQDPIHTWGQNVEHRGAQRTDESPYFVVWDKFKRQDLRDCRAVFSVGSKSMLTGGKNGSLPSMAPRSLAPRVIRIAPFANRLAMNVPPNIQFLRCLTNYEALRFSLPISTLAKKLVNRMIDKSSSTGGMYISVHLRFEEDMVAFSCCLYDGGEAENLEMDSIREKGWGEKFKRKAHVSVPGLNRINGKCPMTPLEVGMVLRGMGFANNTPIYLASGKLYHAERNLDPLLQMFPLLQTKESLSLPEELASFEVKILVPL